MDWPTQSDDLSLLASQSTEDVSNVIRERYLLQRPVSFIGQQSILSLQTQDTGIAQEYLKQSEQQLHGDFNSVLPPHIHLVVANTFHQMVHTQENQSIMLWGQSASGKTLNQQEISKQLILAARNGKKKSKVLSGAARIEVALASFGCFQTSKSKHSSGFGRLTEYQYSKSGRMVGLKVLDYGFNKTRVTNTSNMSETERTFNIFYQLLAGYNEDEKNELDLSDSTNFVYTKGVAPPVRSGTLSRKLTLSRNKSVSKSKPTPESVNQEKEAFENLKSNLKSLGVGRRVQSQIFKVLAAILHLGNLVFYEDENGKCAIKNTETLETCARLLEVSLEQLKNTLLYKSKVVGKDTFSSLLTFLEAPLHRDTLSQCLYSLLFTWLIAHINERLCKPEDDYDCFIAVGDFPFISSNGNESSKIDLFISNYCVEKLYNFNQRVIFEDSIHALKSQGLNINEIQYLDNQYAIDLYDGTARIPGLWKCLQDGLTFDVPPENTFEKTIVVAFDGKLKSSQNYLQSSQCSATETSGNGAVKPLFGVKHYISGPSVEYDVESFYGQDSVVSDFVALFRGVDMSEAVGNNSTFIANLFSSRNGVKVYGDKGRNEAKQSNEPLRRPSMKGVPKSTSKDSDKKSSFEEVKQTVSALISCLEKTRKWNVYCINPLNEKKEYSMKLVEDQLVLLNIRELVALKSIFDVDIDSGISYDNFINKYGPLVSTLGATKGGATSIDATNAFISKQYWPSRDFFCGTHSLFLSIQKWRWLDSALARFNEQSLEPRESGNFMNFTAENTFLRDDDQYSEPESLNESEYRFKTDEAAISSKQIDIESGNKAVLPVHEHIEVSEDLTGSRKCWICCAWTLTWWIPGFCLGCCGGMKRNDIRMAWREKVALCLIIGFLCIFLLFFIIGLRYIICPTQNVLTQDEVRALKSPRFSEKPYQAYFSAFGQYMDATDLMDSHKRAYGSGSGPNAVPNFLFESYYGEDISFLFFKADAWAYYCPGLPNPPEDWDNLDAGIDWQKRDRINPSLDKIHRNLGTNGVPQLYADNLFLYTKGLIGWSREVIKQKSSAQRVYIVLFNNVYYTSPMAASADAFAPEIKELFGPNNQGQDITKKFVQARRSNPRLYDNSLNCINNMFYIGTVDTRDTFQCRITNSLLFGASIVLVAVIGVKFLAALQFGTKTEPEQADKFVILMVPCYTEGVESLTKTLDSLSTFKYDDKRKLLMVICDGMIIGSGNDRPTPRIVLDILGVDPSEDPEPLAFQSLGEGSKQYNMGKVYSGLYEIRGHAVPFVVIVKCGSAKERVKPGNRGKRDSQLILMRFLNRVHFNAVFSPLELEMYHQMKNVIGVSPSFYEFVLMVDADTEVESSSLNRMVSIMVNDAKIIGLCGETKIANEKESWVTMIQVYEYFISHHLAKAFESLFGTVTCLPGCFSMFRIRSANKNVPVLVAPGILSDFSVNTVDTLHKKNLLHLGEDRYLTTLLLKHFPTMRTKFTGEAKCYTVAPERWAVLLSQRRRWINSTVHNLLELFLLDQLCGFCCFSMRFVVMLDLFATFVQPATILYIGYLIFAVSTSREVFPLLSLILIGAIYGFQIIIFILKREWQHIAWMIIYLLATPVIAFYIPCYAFWHFDDFSWGNTRVVVGEGKKTVYVADSEPFDPKSIPLKKWRDFEEHDLYEADSQMSESAYDVKSRGGPRSEYSLHAPRSEHSFGSAAGQSAQRASFQSIEGRSKYQSMMSGVAPPSLGSGEITDEMLYNEIRIALVGADLMTLTKKQIRDNLSAKLGVDLKSRKETMNRMIDELLSEQ